MSENFFKYLQTCSTNELKKLRRDIEVAIRSNPDPIFKLRLASTRVELAVRKQLNKKNLFQFFTHYRHPDNTPSGDNPHLVHTVKY